MQVTVRPSLTSHLWFCSLQTGGPGTPDLTPLLMGGSGSFLGFKGQLGHSLVAGDDCEQEASAL